MAKRPPNLITIKRDDYLAEFVGRTREGRQFFLTTPFVPGKMEFLALYVFGADGRLVGVAIDELGPRENLDYERRDRLMSERLEGLGGHKFRSIRIMPFRVECFGVEFGFIPRDRGDWGWLVTVEPGNYGPTGKQLPEIRTGAWPGSSTWGGSRRKRSSCSL